MYSVNRLVIKKIQIHWTSGPYALEETSTIMKS